MVNNPDLPEDPYPDEPWEYPDELDPYEPEDPYMPEPEPSERPEPNFDD